MNRSELEAEEIKVFKEQEKGFKLPYDVKIGNGFTLKKGVDLEVLIIIAQRYYKEAQESYLKEESLNRDAFFKLLKETIQGK